MSTFGITLINKKIVEKDVGDIFLER